MTTDRRFNKVTAFTKTMHSLLSPTEVEFVYVDGDKQQRKTTNRKMFDPEICNSLRLVNATDITTLQRAVEVRQLFTSLVSKTGSAGDIDAFGGICDLFSRITDVECWFMQHESRPRNSANFGIPHVNHGFVHGFGGPIF